MAKNWRLSGKVLVSCNCDWGCPCNFNARPTTGKCEGGWTWHVEEGSCDGTSLDGLNFSVYANWPGAIHEGNGEALLLIDERASVEQRAAIECFGFAITAEALPPFHLCHASSSRSSPSSCLPSSARMW